MQPLIKTITEKKLIGQRITTSLTNNKTFELWQNFMSRRNEISNAVSAELISMQVYKPSYFTNFNPNTEFEKWAAIEVSDFSVVPNKMETYTLIGGLYAVFLYKGLSTDTKVFEYIFNTWLPNSNYLIDSRPHFEILGEKYKNNDLNSEEEIYIPIKAKT